MKKSRILILLGALLLTGCDGVGASIEVEEGLTRVVAAAHKMEEGSISDILVTKSTKSTLVSNTDEGDVTRTNTYEMRLGGEELLSGNPRLSMHVDGNIKLQSDTDGSVLSIEEDGTLAFYYVDNMFYIESNTPDGHDKVKQNAPVLNLDYLFDYDLSYFYSLFATTSFDDFDFTTLTNVEASEKGGITTVKANFTLDDYLNHIAYLMRALYAELGMTDVEDMIELLLAEQRNMLDIEKYELTFMVGKDGYFHKTVSELIMTTTIDTFSFSENIKESSSYQINKNFKINLPDVSDFVLDNDYDLGIDFPGFIL